jgi:hypothetical protein
MQNNTFIRAGSCAVFLFTHALVFSQKITVEYKTEPLKINEPFEVTYTISDSSFCNFKSHLDSVAMTRKDIALVTGVSTTSNISIINGKRSCTQKATYIFCYLTSGSKELPFICFTGKTTALCSDPVYVNVLASKISTADSLKMLIRKKTASDSAFDAFFSKPSASFFAKASKLKVRKGDTLTVTYELDTFMTGPVVFPEVYIDTNFKSLKKENFGTANVKTEVGTIRLRVIRYTLVAIKPGWFEFPPALIAYKGGNYTHQTLTIQVE